MMLLIGIGADWGAIDAIIFPEALAIFIGFEGATFLRMLASSAKLHSGGPMAFSIKNRNRPETGGKFICVVDVI